MDEDCEELSNIQFDDDKVSETQDDDDDEEEEEEEEDDEEDDTVSTSKSSNEQKGEENAGSGNELVDVSVKLELDILEGEENQNTSKDQKV